MHFSAFLKKISEKDFFSKAHIFGFKGKEYPILFFSLLLKTLHERYDIPIQKISLSDSDQASLESQLSMSFLGNQQLYWFGNISDLDTKKRHAWLTYATAYKGPHKLLFFLDDTTDKYADTLVEIPSFLYAQQYDELQAFFRSSGRNMQSRFVKNAFNRLDKASLDASCLLMEYQAVVGSGSDVFIHEWLPKVIPSEKSLFLLSQYFFARSVKNFMTLWRDIQHEYPDVFWVTFWSEQLWRAYYVVTLYKEKKIAEAKKISYRLPFSFVQRDWRMANTRELLKAHDFIYDLDYKIKNGLSDKGLDLFYAKFFAGEFS